MDRHPLQEQRMRGIGYRRLSGYIAAVALLLLEPRMPPTSPRRSSSLKSPSTGRLATACTFQRLRQLRGGGLDEQYRRWENEKWSTSATDEDFRIRSPEDKRLDPHRDQANYLIDEGDVPRLTELLEGLSEDDAEQVLCSPVHKSAVSVLDALIEQFLADGDRYSRFGLDMDIPIHDAESPEAASARPIGERIVRTLKVILRLLDMKHPLERVRELVATAAIPGIVSLASQKANRTVEKYALETFLKVTDEKSFRYISEGVRTEPSVLKMLISVVRQQDEDVCFPAVKIIKNLVRIPRNAEEYCRRNGVFALVECLIKKPHFTDHYLPTFKTLQETTSRIHKRRLALELSSQINETIVRSESMLKDTAADERNDLFEFVPMPASIEDVKEGRISRKIVQDITLYNIFFQLLGAYLAPDAVIQGILGIGLMITADCSRAEQILHYYPKSPAWFKSVADYFNGDDPLAKKINKSAKRLRMIIGERCVEDALENYTPNATALSAALDHDNMTKIDDDHNDMTEIDDDEQVICSPLPDFLPAVDERLAKAKNI